MLNLKQIDQRISTLRKSGYTKVHQTVQEIAVPIVNHANDTGDCSRARSLVRVVPAKLRPLLVTWFNNVSPINVTIGKTANEDKVRLRKDTQKGFNVFDVAKAQANNWWENPFNVETAAKPPKTLKDYYDAFERQLERYKTEASDAEKVNPDDAARVLAFRAHMRAAFLEFKDGATLENWAGDEGEQEETTEQPDDAEAAMAAAMGVAA